jgi:hypothetical protein
MVRIQAAFLPIALDGALRDTAHGRDRREGEPQFVGNDTFIDGVVRIGSIARIYASSVTVHRTRRVVAGNWNESRRTWPYRIFPLLKTRIP